MPYIQRERECVCVCVRERERETVFADSKQLVVTVNCCVYSSNSQPFEIGQFSCSEIFLQKISKLRILNEYGIMERRINGVLLQLLY